MKARYGHPDSGVIWERHCDQDLCDIGFVEVPSWRSVYHHYELQVLLVVYVEDFKMAGPPQGIREAWRRIRLKVEDPTPFGLILGCRHEMGEAKLGPNGPTVRTMTYNVESHLQDSITSYMSLLLQGTRLKNVSTPFLANGLGQDTCAPCQEGVSRQCPWCRGPFHESEFLPSDNIQNKRRKLNGGISIPADEEPPTRGALADKAASVLMKVLYAARYARFDLLCAVARLAPKDQ